MSKLEDVVMEALGNIGEPEDPDERTAQRLIRKIRQDLDEGIIMPAGWRMRLFKNGDLSLSVFKGIGRRTWIDYDQKSTP